MIFGSLYSTKGDFVNTAELQKSRSYGVKSLQEVSVMSGGGPHLLKTRNHNQYTRTIG